MAVVALCLAVWAVYVPTALLNGSHALVGLDFDQLHARRIAYAQQAMRAADAALPAWHSRELLGAPFWANTQSFPFIPTRLILLWCDPYVVHGAGVALAGTLAALFTYLFARRLGLGCVASAAAGWTFACSGFFASRVLAGHLPLLEAYPALPLLLWLVEGCVQSGPADRRYGWWLAGLGLATTCTVLAGHPQLPFYALLAAVLYLMVRGWGRPGWHALGAMICGAGMAAFSLYPMFRLIQRSTRVLRLDEPDNNIYFPYSRLLAFIAPWRDGAAPGVHAHGAAAFHGYPNYAYFWDTVCYVGLLPLAAVVFVLARWIRQRPPLDRRWLCLAGGGLLALVAALPITQHALAWIPGTILRSPCRQLYLTTFALALGLGAALHTLLALRAKAGRLWPAITVIALGLHALDLGRHARAFVQTRRLPPVAERAVTPAIASFVGDARVAIDTTLPIPWNRAVDDVGFFDSIMLAKPYQALLALNDLPSRLNTQMMSGGDLSARYLAYAGARLVISTRQRPDLPRIGAQDPVFLYEVPRPRARAEFVSARAAVFLDEPETLARLRNSNVNLADTILLPPDAARASKPAAAATGARAAARYRRESSDAIAVTLKVEEPGFVRIAEAWDPGWTASVDGREAEVLCADGAVMAVAVDATAREVRLQYATPGAREGAALSGLSLFALLGLVGWAGVQAHRNGSHG